MSATGWDIQATVHMSEGRVTLRMGAGVTLGYLGTVYPGRVLECRTPIGPGQTGEALIGLITLTTPPERLDLKKGAVLELRDGPGQVATATVLVCRLV